MENPQFLRAVNLIQANQFADAAPLLLDLHEQFPQEPRVNYCLGLVHNHFGELRLAMQCLTDAASVAKKQPDVFTTLAEVQNNLGNHQAALEAGRRAVSLNRQSEYAHINLGDAYYYLRKPVMARKSYGQAAEVAPQSGAAHLCLCRLETSLGDLKAATEHLAKALELEPGNPRILLEAADNAELSGKPEVLASITQMLDDPNANVSPEIRGKLGLAAGKLLEKQGDLGKAFERYTSFRTGLYRTYDLNLRKWFLETAKGVFTTEFFETRKDVGLESDRPVFVVGMPRSGTTLVEQILARHPKAYGAGELNYFLEMEADFAEAEIATPGLFQKAIATDNKTYKRIGRKYLTLLEGLDRKSRRAIDKMPHNFEMLWLIALLFPNAKVIHVQREPADTCSSIYTTPLKRFHSYSIDQETLGTYYGLYAELMEHWDAVLPIEIRHQSYEALVEDLEGESRALLEFIGLPWDPACLDFQSGEEQVLTFSNQQVRQPVFKSSIGRWKKYEPHIQPLLNALGKHAPNSGGK